MNFFKQITKINDLATRAARAESSVNDVFNYRTIAKRVSLATKPPTLVFSTTDPTTKLSVLVANQRSNQTAKIVAPMTELSALVAGAVGCWNGGSSH